VSTCNDDIWREEVERFSKVLESRGEYARDWKRRTGGKVLGFYEPYMPEEVVYAAGILPVRLLARHEPDDVTDRQMYGNCSCSRDLLNQFIKGRYDYVDGLVNAEGCQWMFSAFQTTLNNNPDLFNHYVFVPDYPDARTSKDVLHSELKVFKSHLEKWTGKTITDEDLDRAIDIYNTNRRLMRQVYELRRADNPVVSGSEAMEMVLASQIMDKAEMNGMLQEAIAELAKRTPPSDGDKAVRLMLIGSETSDVELEKIVESLGANIVIDELETGSSYFWNEVIPQHDRLMALSLRYLGRPHSAIKDNNWRRRPEHIYQLIEDFQVEGVIIAKQIYCHPHGTDNYMVWKLLRERSIPFHFFERDTTLPYEETRLRMDAFINMIKPGLNRLAGLTPRDAFASRGTEAAR
jgi:benzoyl-CoA reductase subunit C